MKTLALFCSCTFWVATATAEEPAGLLLMRPDSLAGWDYGTPPPAGWEISGGRLTGTAQSTPLVSGFSFGDVELRFQWAVGDAGAWKVLLPESPRGKGLEIVFCEGLGAGRLTDGERELAAGGNVAPRADGMHSAAIRRRGGRLSVEIDGRTACDAQIASERRFGLGLAVLRGRGSLAGLRVREPAGTPIFNGKDLAGWWCPGTVRAWSVEDGELVLEPGGGNYLRTEKLFGNFTLSLEYKAKKGTNSGIGIRTPRQAWPSGDGMELQIADDRPSTPLNKHSMMAIYGNIPPLARADRSEQWNQVVVKADGWMISAWVNGELVQQCNTFDHPEMKHRNLQGWIGFQDHGSWIRVRDIRVLESPEGQGLDAWRQPGPPRATAAVLDRLMNPERLSVHDGIVSGVVTASVKGEAGKAKKEEGGAKKEEGGSRAGKKAGGKTTPGVEHVLAELTGPGAVVRIARTGADGRVAFYFDGEAKPRIECRAADLHQRVPQIAEDNSPTLTCLTYKKSLRVTLRDARDAEYRLDYLTFPEKYQVDSFVNRESGFARGWLSATVYRHGQGAWGVHREYDPLPRAATPKKVALKPGETRPLVSLDGAGVVHWLKLQADKKLLDTDDLWLEAVVDGRPSVAAPARFWYPGLAGQGSFDNFVMTDRGGPTLRLAMPYGKSVEILAGNRGTRPIRDVGMTVSYEPATEATVPDIAGRMRLCGVFLPAGSAGPLVRLQGPGRWVGLVCENPADGVPRIESLAVDGSPRPGWPGDFDLFLGLRGDFRKCLSGRQGRLSWHYLWLAPVDFRKSLELTTAPGELGARLAWFYRDP